MNYQHIEIEGKKKNLPCKSWCRCHLQLNINTLRKYHWKWGDKKDLENSEIEEEKRLNLQKLMQMVYVTKLNTLEKHYYKWGDKNFINVTNKKCTNLLLTNMNVGDYRWENIKWSLATTNKQKHKSKGANANDLRCISKLKFKDLNDIENKFIVPTKWDTTMQKKCEKKKWKPNIHDHVWIMMKDMYSLNL
jgi:hypothetical protein